MIIAWIWRMGNVIPKILNIVVSADKRMSSPIIDRFSVVRFPIVVSTDKRMRDSKKLRSCGGQARRRLQSAGLARDLLRMFFF